MDVGCQMSDVGCRMSGSRNGQLEIGAQITSYPLRLCASALNVLSLYPLRPLRRPEGTRAVALNVPSHRPPATDHRQPRWN
jgi:hypothetical protein